jgi:UDP-2,3-diacylglucosamine pyrophosphatase LpxH
MDAIAGIAVHAGGRLVGSAAAFEARGYGFWNMFSVLGLSDCNPNIFQAVRSPTGPGTELPCNRHARVTALAEAQRTDQEGPMKNRHFSHAPPLTLRPPNRSGRSGANLGAQLRATVARPGTIDRALGPTPEDTADGSAPRHFRAIFISDLHLGTPGCQAEKLLDFLRTCRSDYLYLMGDIVDGWQLRRRWYWPQVHNDVVQKLLRRARKGRRVAYLPGNHDEFARQFTGDHFSGIEVRDEATHVTAAARRLWVVHGDRFAAVIQCAKWLAYLGDNLYESRICARPASRRWRCPAPKPRRVRWISAGPMPARCSPGIWCRPGGRGWPAPRLSQACHPVAEYWAVIVLSNFCHHVRRPHCAS